MITVPLILAAVAVAACLGPAPCAYLSKRNLAGEPGRNVSKPKGEGHQYACLTCSDSTGAARS